MGRPADLNSGPIIARMDKFLAWDGWAFVGIALAIVAIIASVIAARAWGTRRAHLAYQVDANRLIAHYTPTGIKITHRDTALTDPWLVVIRLANTGPRDITSTSFHNGEWARLELGAKVVVVLDVSDPSLKLRGAGTTIEVEPFHLPRRAEVTFTCLLDGEPDRLSFTPLIDTDVVLVQRGSFVLGVQQGIVYVLSAWFEELVHRVSVTLVGRRK